MWGFIVHRNVEGLHMRWCSAGGSQRPTTVWIRVGGFRVSSAAVRSAGGQEGQRLSWVEILVWISACKVRAFRPAGRDFSAKNRDFLLFYTAGGLLGRPI